MYTFYMSDNPISAENQQERLIQRGWVIGFVDGEGCFSIGFVKQSDRNETKRCRKGYKTGYQVNHKFSVVQGAKSLHCLEELQKFFRVGKVYLNRRHDNHKEHMYCYNVQKRFDLLETIIPFFKRNPMHSSKQEDFLKFVHCMEIIQRDDHLTEVGLIEIAKIAQTMNRQKPRKALIKILRGHTPNIQDTG